MSMTNEQIQALKAAENITEQLPAALEAWEKSNQGSVTLGWIHAANPVAVESLLAERDADKALIAEQAKRIAELEASLKAAEMNETDARYHVAELEARTLTVKLPEGYKPHVQKGGTQSTSYRAVMSGKGPWIHRDMLIEACAAAGITLDVGE